MFPVVRFSEDIEPLVRFVEETPPEKIVEETLANKNTFICNIKQYVIVIFYQFLVIANEQCRMV